MTMTFTYKKLKNPVDNKEETSLILRKEDGVFIPFDEANTDYQEYLEWVSKGNTPEEAD